MALAVLMGKGEKVLQNKLNPNNDQHLLNVDEFEMLADFTNNNLSAAEYFAAKCNAVVVTLPAVAESDMALLDLYMAAMKELGEVAGAFQEAYADGRITPREFDKIALEIDDVLAKLLEFKGAINRVVR